MWSEESRCALFQSDGRIGVRRGADEVMPPSCSPAAKSTLGEKILRVCAAVFSLCASFLLVNGSSVPAHSLSVLRSGEDSAHQVFLTSSFRLTLVRESRASTQLYKLAQLYKIALLALAVSCGSQSQHTAGHVTSRGANHMAESSEGNPVQKCGVVSSSCAQHSQSVIFSPDAFFCSINLMKPLDHQDRKGESLDKKRTFSYFEKHLGGLEESEGPD